MKLVNLLVIGKTSLLAKSIKKNTKIKKIKFISYKEIKKINFNNYTHVINLSIDPKNFYKDYRLINKIDEKICKLIDNQNCIYIFPSSRLVYSKLKKNFYGKNKKKTEKKIISLRKEYLILRISTFLTFDISKRNLFISKALRSLKKNNYIKLDISKNTYKDFMISEIFVKILDALIIGCVTGTYNISSNIPISVNDIFKSIIKGRGKGKIIYGKIIKKNDSFLINNNKLTKKIRFKITKKDILNYCVNLGKQLNA